MATTAVSVCLRCGTIGKFGKMSCCGRGGSWFKSCGGAGNTKRQHTWHEGIQACKARSQSNTVIAQQLNVAQQKDKHSSQGVDMTNDKAVSANTVSEATSIVTPTYTSENMSFTTSASTPIITQRCVNLMLLFISMFLSVILL